MVLPQWCPGCLSFLLVPLYTYYLPTEGFGEVAIVFSWMAVFNVLLAYGMETSFFRFFHQEDFRKEVVATSSISLIVSTIIFLVLGFLLKDIISEATAIASHYIVYVLFILALDAWLLFLLPGYGQQRGQGFLRLSRLEMSLSILV